MPASNIDRLRETLDELFMLDRADLDFGLYRIMNVRRDEVRRFLDHDLLPKVRAALGQMQAGEHAATEAEMRALEKTLRDADVDPATSPKFRELEAKYHAAGGTAADEAEVYGHLVSFFRRYYKEGDFISLRRYKEGVYAIPYEGEEVKLHWANADQYYIKSTEQFRDYTFLVSHEDEPERRVHFKLVEADTERNNNRAQAGQDRRFVLIEADPVAEVDGDLVVRFEYRPANGAKQDALNTEAEATVLDHPAAMAWRSVLARDVRREGAKDALSLLRKHLNTYTAKSTFDYFIHKDLGGFLRRELDFYLKNEVLRLDDIDTDGATSATLDAALRKVRAIRAVGLPIVEFLTSLEEFQKRLWLKKKFVVETHYCVTLDRVPRDLYAEVAASDRQREEWVRLFAIDELRSNLPPYTEPLTMAFLDANQSLLVDTSLFNRTFTDRVLAGIENLDDAVSGLLVHGDNFQALNLLQSRFAGTINALYLDPPYNTDASEIAYKNDYRDSSWLALLQDRMSLSRYLASEAAVACVTIDDAEIENLLLLMKQHFGATNHLGTVPIRNNPQGRSTVKGLRVSHEYALFFGMGDGAKRLGRLPHSEKQIARYGEVDAEGVHYLWENFRKTGTDSRRRDRPRQFYPVFVSDTGIRVPELEWPQDGDGWVTKAEPRNGETVLWPIDDADRERVWKWGAERAREQSDWLKLSLDSEGRAQVVMRADINQEGSLPGTWWDKAKYAAGSHGTNLLTAMFGDRHGFPFPKSVYAVEDCLQVAGARPGSAVLDFFGGSGTTAHAVINLNRGDGGARKYILVEIGEYFDTVLKPRVLKATYSKDWKGGKPVDREGVSQLIKVIRLESYEDTLTNLRNPKPSNQQASLLQKAGDGFRQQYALRYWLTEETRGSASLLDLERFEDPWSYTLEVGQGSAAETKPVTVDLVETFNYLLGLRVQHADHIRGVTLVQGTLPPGPGKTAGEKALVIWRNTREMDAEALDSFLWSQRINPRDLEFDVIFVNGDNHLENSRRADEAWKVRLIEDEFHRLMFETAEQERKQ